MDGDADRQRLAAIARQSPWFMDALVAARSLGLDAWCIGAGAVRNLVWDALHGYRSPSWLADIDLAYFDDSDIAPERDATLQRRLASRSPGPWEVTNQAGVHLWFEEIFGHPVRRLGSLPEAVASWPEFATSVGIWLDAAGSIEIIAPHGLDDLFGMTVRRNPARVSVETYRQRVQQKRYTERWPLVTVVPE